MKRADLVQAGFDNWNTQPTGVDPEVLADIGYAATVYQLADAADRTLDRQIARERLDPVDPTNRLHDLLSAVDLIGREGQTWGIRRPAVRPAAHGQPTKKAETVEITRRLYFDSAKVMLGRALGYVTFTESELCFERYKAGDVVYPEADSEDTLLSAETRGHVDSAFADFLKRYGKPEKPTDMKMGEYRRRSSSAKRARKSFKLELQRDIEQAQDESPDLQAA